MTRLCETANAGLEQRRDTDDWWCIHESDLISPIDVIPRLRALGEVAAGWVTLGDGPCFYDTYVYRKNGIKFLNDPPYHPAITLDKPFTVDSAGSVLLFPASAIRKGLRMTRGGLAEFCDKLRVEGHTIWVDPQLRIIQPVELWAGADHPSY